MNNRIENQVNGLSPLDNLKLSDLPVPEIPNEIIFPNELNQYLRDQIQYLAQENCMLKKNLSENEFQRKQSESKMECLSSQIKEYQNAYNNNGYANASNLASSKIVELSKKLREKNSEIEVLKTKCSKLEERIFGIENAKHKDEPIPEKPVPPPNELQERIKALQEKLNCTATKLFEAKNLNVQLRNDLKLANRLLQQEVGDNFESLQMLVNSNTSTWRGRSQIICDLQQKNNDLREKIKIFQNKLCMEPQPTSQTKIETKVDILTKENNELKNSLEAMKKKSEARRVRCKYYESECCALKAKISAIAEQSERAHELITNLTAKLSHSQDAQNDVVKHKQQIINKMEQENKHLNLELEREKCKSVNLQKEIDNRMSKIEVLKKKSHDAPSSMAFMKQNADDNNKSRLEVEKQKLVEFIEVCNKRLESERNLHASIHNQYLLERQRAAKLEANLARMQLQTNRSSSYTALSIQSKVTDYNNLEDQLELAKENIKSLQTRLQIEQQERRLDYQEFSKILQNYNNKVN